MVLVVEKASVLNGWWISEKNSQLTRIRSLPVDYVTEQSQPTKLR